MIKKQSSSGIVYVLTKRDALQVSAWLTQQGIDSAAYYSGVHKSGFDDRTSSIPEERLLSNELKVLVATTAQAWGMTNPISASLFTSRLGSIVGYYQQVGRAGRGISHAEGVLLSGREDEKIHAFFVICTDRAAG